MSTRNASSAALIFTVAHMLSTNPYILSVSMAFGMLLVILSSTKVITTSPANLNTDSSSHKPLSHSLNS